MTASANAAQAVMAAAPTAVQTQGPIWLGMADKDFDQYVVTAKIGTNSKRAAEMRARRADFRALDSTVVPGGPTAPAVPVSPEVKRKMKADVVAAAIALDKAPPEALRTRYIDPNLIDVRDDWNARTDFGDLEELGRGILAQKKLDGHGFVDDIRVVEKPNGRFELIDGERRMQTVWGLMQRGESWDFGVPAKVEPATSTDADLIIKMFTANGGKPFLPYEEALYFKRLRASGMTIAQIQEKTGRSDHSIVAALALLDAHEDVLEAVIKGDITGTEAKSIAVNVRGDHDKQKELTARIKTAKAAGDKKGVAQVKREVDKIRAEKHTKRTGKTTKLRRVEDALLADMGTQAGLRLKYILEAMGMPYDTDLDAWARDNQELTLAATFGVLQGLKAAAGVEVDLTFGVKGAK